MGAPTVVALQEVENIRVLEDLILLEVLEPYGYEAYLLEGTDSRGIDVGFLVRTSRTRVINVKQAQVPEELSGRPPLILELNVAGAGDAGQLFLINNHFTSLTDGVEATLPARTRQAEQLMGVAVELRKDHPGAEVILVGDLNSFYSSQPVDLLRQAGWPDVFDSLAREDRYTYNYQGVSQLLDYILVSPQFLEKLTRVTILHLNADFPLSLPDEMSIYRVSDHDPVVALFTLP
jgi:predicted extracellular nuclease